MSKRGAPSTSEGPPVKRQSGGSSTSVSATAEPVAFQVLDVVTEGTWPMAHLTHDVDPKLFERPWPDAKGVFLVYLLEAPGLPDAPALDELCTPAVFDRQPERFAYVAGTLPCMHSPLLVVRSWATPRAPKSCALQLPTGAHSRGGRRWAKPEEQEDHFAVSVLGRGCDLTHASQSALQLLDLQELVRHQAPALRGLQLCGGKRGMPHEFESVQAPLYKLQRLEKAYHFRTLKAAPPGVHRGLWTGVFECNAFLPRDLTWRLEDLQAAVSCLSDLLLRTEEQAAAPLVVSRLGGERRAAEVVGAFRALLLSLGRCSLGMQALVLRRLLPGHKNPCGSDEVLGDLDETCLLSLVMGPNARARREPVCPMGTRAQELLAALPQDAPARALFPQLCTVWDPTDAGTVEQLALTVYLRVLCCKMGDAVLLAADEEQRKSAERFAPPEWDRHWTMRKQRLQGAWCRGIEFLRGRLARLDRSTLPSLSHMLRDAFAFLVREGFVACLSDDPAHPQAARWAADPAEWAESREARETLVLYPHADHRMESKLLRELWALYQRFYEGDWRERVKEQQEALCTRYYDQRGKRWVQLTEEQEGALREALRYPLGGWAGFAGTGKSVIRNCACSLAAEPDTGEVRLKGDRWKRVLTVAFLNRVREEATRNQQACCFARAEGKQEEEEEEETTSVSVADLLAREPQSSQQQKFQQKEREPLQAVTAHWVIQCAKSKKTFERHQLHKVETLVLEEAGVFPVELLLRLILALCKHCPEGEQPALRQILVTGDDRQLPPVEGICLLFSLMQALPRKMALLRTLHRQREESVMGRVVNAVRNMTFDVPMGTAQCRLYRPTRGKVPSETDAMGKSGVALNRLWRPSLEEFVELVLGREEWSVEDTLLCCERRDDCRVVNEIVMRRLQLEPTRVAGGERVLREGTFVLFKRNTEFADNGTLVKVVGRQRMANGDYNYTLCPHDLIKAHAKDPASVAGHLKVLAHSALQAMEHVFGFCITSYDAIGKTSDGMAYYYARDERWVTTRHLYTAVSRAANRLLCYGEPEHMRALAARLPPYVGTALESNLAHMDALWAEAVEKGEGEHPVMPEGMAGEEE